jgi:hypothetical protein
VEWSAVQWGRGENSCTAVRRLQQLLRKKERKKEKGTRNEKKTK